MQSPLYIQQLLAQPQAQWQASGKNSLCTRRQGFLELG